MPRLSAFEHQLEARPIHFTRRHFLPVREESTLLQALGPEADPFLLMDTSSAYRWRASPSVVLSASERSSQIPRNISDFVTLAHASASRFVRKVRVWLG